jgi:hypothetical protein
MLLGYRDLQSAQRRAINMRLLRKPQRRAMRSVEHPLRDFNQHRTQRCIREFAQECYLGVRAAGPARQNTTTIPAMPWITHLPGIKGDIVGFL